jgi:hypothetical protein
MDTLTGAKGTRYLPGRLMVAMILISTMLTSCAPTYDSIADQMLVDTQKQADDGLLKLENLGNQIDGLKMSHNASDQKAMAEAEAQASYASNIDFYSKLQSSMTVLDARMTSNPDLSTQKISTSLADLEKNIDATRQVHVAENVLKPDFVKQMRQTWDQQFKVLTVYELTIKNGSKTKSP